MAPGPQQKPLPAGDEEAGEFASPACFLHEIDPVYAGLAPATKKAPPRDGSASPSAAGTTARPPHPKG